MHCLIEIQHLQKTRGGQYIGYNTGKMSQSKAII